MCLYVIQQQHEAKELLHVLFLLLVHLIAHCKLCQKEASSGTASKIDYFLLALFSYTLNKLSRECTWRWYLKSTDRIAETFSN